MNALMIVKLQVVSQLLSSFFWRAVLMQIHFFVFNGSPQPFCKDIVKCSSFSIHTNLYFCCLKELSVLWAGEMTALIAITNRRRRLI